MTAPGFSRDAILGLLERSTEDIDARYSSKVVDEIAADLPTMAAMKLAAERSKDIEGLGQVARALGIDDTRKLVELAYEK